MFKEFLIFFKLILIQSFTHSAQRCATIFPGTPACAETKKWRQWPPNLFFLELATPMKLHCNDSRRELDLPRLGNMKMNTQCSKIVISSMRKNKKMAIEAPCMFSLEPAKPMKLHCRQTLTLVNT